MNPKKIGLGAEIESAFGDDQKVQADDAAVKGAKEAARKFALETDLRE